MTDHEHEFAFFSDSCLVCGSDHYRPHSLEDETCDYNDHGTCNICGSYDYDPYRDSLAIVVRDGKASTVRCSAEGCNDVVRSWSHEGLCKEHHLELHHFRAIVETDTWGVER